ncbi:MAG: hypothetical protein DME69_07715, partial [Verrucomicrobia bacterium]
RWRTEKPHPLIGSGGWIKCDGENEKRNSKKRAKYLEHARIIERSRKGNKFVGKLSASYAFSAKGAVLTRAWAAPQDS